LKIPNAWIALFGEAKWRHGPLCVRRRVDAIRGANATANDQRERENCCESRTILANDSRGFAKAYG